jgi:hypothetical protein
MCAVSFEESGCGGSCLSYLTIGRGQPRVPNRVHGIAGLRHMFAVRKNRVGLRWEVVIDTVRRVEAETVVRLAHLRWNLAVRMPSVATVRGCCPRWL